MKTSIANRYAARMLAARTPADSWQWPQSAGNSPAAPDPRLLDGEIRGLTARVTLGDGTLIEAGIRAVSQHDVVLLVNDPAKLPVQGQIVSVCVCLKGDVLLDELQCILHWSGIVHGQALVALFTVEPMGAIAKQWQGSGQRGEIRFPIDVPAALECEEDEPAYGRIVDYSLSGCRFHCVDEIELSVEYETTVLFPHATVELNLTPRWVLNSEDSFQLGCSFRPEQGVLMACRHHPAATGLSFPLEPKTADWTPQS